MENSKLIFVSVFSFALGFFVSNYNYTKFKLKLEKQSNEQVLKTINNINSISEKDKLNVKVLNDNIDELNSNFNLNNDKLKQMLNSNNKKLDDCILNNSTLLFLNRSLTNKKEGK